MIRTIKEQIFRKQYEKAILVITGFVFVQLQCITHSNIFDTIFVGVWLVLIYINMTHIAKYGFKYADWVERRNEPEFNNGFITALCLFYGHREQFMESSRRMGCEHDLRLYAAADHLFDIEIPPELPLIIRAKLGAWRSYIMEHRLGRDMSSEVVFAIFDGCADIIALIDEWAFIGEKVEVNYK